MRLTLIIKKGAKTLGEFPGLMDVDPKVSELVTIVVLEQMLERWLGYRFHINEVPEDARDKT